MSDTRYIVKKVFYTYHPDFVQDDTAPNGYHTLNTGRWVVEWDVKKYVGNLPHQIMHYTREFSTELGAELFVKRVQRGLDKNNSFIVDKNNAFILGAK